MTSNVRLIPVQSQSLLPLLTCSICNKLFRDATTVTVCLHSFCNTCIHKKITEENLSKCPQCNRDLGSAPLQCLRTDHILQELKVRIIGTLKRQNMAVVSSCPLAAGRQQDKSVSTKPNVVLNNSNQTTVMTRRRRTPPPPTTKGPDSIEEEEEEEPITQVENRLKCPGSPATRSNNTQNEKTVSSVAPESSEKNRKEPLEDMPDIWNRLNCLVKVAGSTKLNKSSSISKGSAAKAPTSSVDDNEDRHCRLPMRREEKGLSATQSGSVETKTNGSQQKEAVPCEEEQRTPPRPVVDSASIKFERSLHPVMALLVASDQQEGDEPPLPQIPSSHLTVKDSHQPVLFVKQYISRVMRLESPDEVEVTLNGESLGTELGLDDLIEIWSQTETYENTAEVEEVLKITKVDFNYFILCLKYARKVL